MAHSKIANLNTPSTINTLSEKSAAKKVQTNKTAAQKIAAKKIADEALEKQTQQTTKPKDKLAGMIKISAQSLEKLHAQRLAKELQE